MKSRSLAALVVLLLATVPAAGLAGPLDDDAGMGRDAPATPDPSFLVPAGVVLSGTMVVVADGTDTYAFEGALGQKVQVRARGLVGCATLLAPDGADFAALGCSYGEALDLPSGLVTLDRSGVWYVQFDQVGAGSYRFIISLDVPAADVSLTGPLGAMPLFPGSDPTCGTGAPVTATQGGGDAALPTLAYAALKTGFRAVVAWETAGLVAATLTASVDGGPAQVFEERVPQRQHVFILDGLPEGHTLCFTPQGGSAHAMRLANAMNAYEGGAYSINLLVLANEQPDRAALDASLARFAQSLWDAADGHVRAGRVLTLYGDFLHHNSGWVSCFLTTVGTADRPLCHNVHDVLFTYDGSIGGAAQTYADAIRHPDRAIWMNQYFQAPLVGLRDDAGRVLNHEMGHYAFGAQDLYGNLAGTGPDCWDPAKGLSVMGGSRAATEFDDETNRCPNEARLPGYIPTWTLLRQDFPNVPARSVIDAGPAGDGGLFRSHLFVFAPQVSDRV